MNCPVCGQPFTPARRQQHCGDRRRHHNLPAPLIIPPARPRREHTICQCPDCEQRLLGEQRHPDCGIFARRTGPGGPCPHRDEPVAIADLTREVASMPAAR
jgi:hypothetical protein